MLEVSRSGRAVAIALLFSGCKFPELPPLDEIDGTRADVAGSSPKVCVNA
jgi:hypothetical protein